MGWCFNYILWIVSRQPTFLQQKVLGVECTSMASVHWLILRISLLTPVRKRLLLYFPDQRIFQIRYGKQAPIKARFDLSMKKGRIMWSVVAERVEVEKQPWSIFCSSWHHPEAASPALRKYSLDILYTFPSLKWMEKGPGNFPHFPDLRTGGRPWALSRHSVCGICLTPADAPTDFAWKVCSIRFRKYVMWTLENIMVTPHQLSR